MNILYYTNEFPKISETFVLNEIHELYNRGHNIAVFALREGNKEITHDEFYDLDIPVYYVDLSYTDVTRLLPKRLFSSQAFNILKSTLPLFPMEIVGVNIVIGNHLLNFIDNLNFDIDIVHGHFANNVKIAQIYATQYRDIQSTVTAHAYEIFSDLTLDQVRYVCENVNHVFVPSEYNKEYLQNEIGVQNSITKVPATTTVSKFDSCAETVPNRVLTVGRLTEKKGHEYGINAVARLVEQGYDIEYHIVGTGEREELLRERVEECGIQEHVEFLGHVSDKQLKIELSEASVFLLPCVIASDGDRDAMPVVLKEAMASETACVSTTVSAIPELITDKYDGILVPPKDLNELTIAIKELLDNPTKRSKLGRNGRQTVKEKFDISKSVTDMESVFKQIEQK
ncbi:glycosyltransferase [Halorubrum sp. ARQ200]|uniref:glycosyltransferase n=1 Tax=Halorubrum sp. ARQ200 TaxID=1855872 RepID=UPI0010F6723A|nr:glycosyltransferase [Halorubrum sp. ARQ200]TKX44655.1 colanic acid biosynthesis glycosyltransferase WcaL [Halorubrum sp. ARQ200]